jgi:16S rRNA A1518/A1519 N6-dimethyltransferase RsmA/KsgA/DIM1 with predicted DNA glycosylase/AP lyase activity
MAFMGKHYQGTSTLEVLEGANNYNAWIAEHISKHVSAPLLEVGAGIGNISKYLLTKKPFCISEIDPRFIAILKKKFGRHRSVTIKTLDVTKRPIKNMQKKFASVVAVNMLEHIKDDKQALKNIRQMLKKNGNLVLLIPAKKKAYTRLDRELGHYRRYEKKEIIEKLISAGFTIKNIYYFNFIGVFTWILRGLITNNNKQLSKSHIALFDKIVTVLKPLEKIMPIPIGISLIVNAHVN